MMGWNYRILRHRTRHGDGTEEITLGVHEVYYHEDGTPHSCTVDIVGAMGSGETDEAAMEQLRADAELKNRAFDKPILDYDAFIDTPALDMHDDVFEATTIDAFSFDALDEDDGA